MRHRAVVKRWVSEKAYGWLARPNEKDLFVHVSEIDMNGYKHLTEGEEVEYTLDVDSKQRECAVDVIPLGTVPNHPEEI